MMALEVVYRKNGTRVNLPGIHTVSQGKITSLPIVLLIVIYHKGLRTEYVVIVRPRNK